MVTQTLPAQSGKFAVTLDRMGAASETLNEFVAAAWVRFGNAPDYVLRKLAQTPGTWNTPEGREGNPQWCGMCAESGESLATYVRARRIWEADMARLASIDPRLAGERVWQTVKRHRDVQVVRGDGPTTTNWSFMDGRDGEYTDCAWSSSEEIAPGIWLEKKHACMGRTRAWFVIAPAV